MKHLKLKFTCFIVFLLAIAFQLSAQTTLTIEQALDIAEENNPQMKNSKLNFERTQFLLEEQRAALKSQFSLNLNPFAYSQTRSFDTRFSEWYTSKRLASYGTFQVDQPFLLTDGMLSLINTFGWQNSQSTNQAGEFSNKAFTNDLYLRFTQPIFTYNRRKMVLQRLEYDHENSGISYALQRLFTESRITNLFYNVYMAQNNLVISLEEFENARKNYEIIKDKVDADLAAREELYQAEVNLANAESKVQLDDVSLNNIKDNLKQTLGMPLSDDIVVLADIVVSPMMVDPDIAIQSGLNSRVELRQREINMELADLQMIQTKAISEFKGDVSLSIGITGDNQRFENIYNNPTQSPRVSVTFNVPIFDWGQKKARIKAQERMQTIAELDYENEKVDIELNIRQTLRKLDNLRIQILIAEKNVRNTQLTYELNQIRYREGDLTGLQMSQYQTQLSNARISHVRAQIDYKTELLNLKILTLYDFENEKPIVPVKNLGNAIEKTTIQPATNTQ
jgi:outer membrane protein TolC